MGNNILLLFMCYSPWIIGDTWFCLVFYDKYLWTLVTNLFIAWICLNGKEAHFQLKWASNKEEPNSTALCVLIVHGYLVMQDFGLFFAKLFYARPLCRYKLPEFFSRANIHIFKFKRIQKWEKQYFTICVC